MVTRVELDDASGRVTGVRYVHDGEERRQRADAVALAGYSIETPRLLLNSTSKRFPSGLANSNDQVGRGVMVQGAPQVAGRFPDELRMYKAPPPEISSEQFYETDEARGFARGFSIQTVGPLPIGWAEHVLADGHWGQALREYMRDYNHWYTLGALSELLPLPENRVTVVSGETDHNNIPVARMDYSQCENDRKNIATAKQTLRGHPAGVGCPGRPRDRPLRPPRRRLPYGIGSRAKRRRFRPPSLGDPQSVHRRRQRDANAGCSQPGTHDHGTLLAPRGPTRPQADRSAPPPETARRPEAVPAQPRRSLTCRLAAIGNGGLLRSMGATRQRPAFHATARRDGRSDHDPQQG